MLGLFVFAWFYQLCEIATNLQHLWAVFNLRVLFASYRLLKLLVLLALLLQMLLLYLSQSSSRLHYLMVPKLVELLLLLYPLSTSLYCLYNSYNIVRIISTLFTVISSLSGFTTFSIHWSASLPTKQRLSPCSLDMFSHIKPAIQSSDRYFLPIAKGSMLEIVTLSHSKYFTLCCGQELICFYNLKIAFQNENFVRDNW